MAHPVPNFDIQKQIGSGQYGKVFYAICTNGFMTSLSGFMEKGIPVAIKQIHYKNLWIPAFLMREVGILQELNHRCIVNLLHLAYGNGDQRGMVVSLVMEYIDGGDLKKYLPISMEKELLRRQLILELLIALDHCHSKHIVHRDVKPANVLISKGHAKLADFGLATCLRGQKSCEVVTSYYRPPDLLLGNNHYGTEVDIWSLGCLIMEMYTGKVLFEGRNNLHQLQCIFQIVGLPTNETWPSFMKYPMSQTVLNDPSFQKLTQIPLKQVCSMVDQNGIDLVTRMLAYEPNQRITAAEALKHSYFYPLYQK